MNDYIYMAAIMNGFQPSDQDVSGTPNYYGFVDSEGSWYIMAENTTSGTYRYAKGDSNYETAWTARAAHSYDHYCDVF